MDESTYLDPLLKDEPKPLRIGWVGGSGSGSGSGTGPGMGTGTGAGAGAGAGAGHGAVAQAGASETRETRELIGYAALATSGGLRRLFEVEDEVEIEDGLEGVGNVEGDGGGQGDDEVGGANLGSGSTTPTTTSPTVEAGQDAARVAGPPPTMNPTPDSDPDSGASSALSAPPASFSSPAATATPAPTAAARPPTHPSNQPQPQPQTPNETLRRLLRLLHTYPRYARKEVLAKLLGFEGELAVDHESGSGKQEGARGSARGGIRGRRIWVDKVPEGGWVLRPFGPEHGGGGIAGRSTNAPSKHGKLKQHPVPNQRVEMDSQAMYIGEKETLAFRAFAECVRGVVGDGDKDAGGGMEWEV